MTEAVESGSGSLLYSSHVQGQGGLLVPRTLFEKVLKRLPMCMLCPSQPAWARKAPPKFLLLSLCPAPSALISAEEPKGVLFGSDCKKNGKNPVGFGTLYSLHSLLALFLVILKKIIRSFH